MKIAVSPSNGRIAPSSAAALSSRRRLVVPTDDQPPARTRARRSAAPPSPRRCGPTRRASGARRYRSAFTGRNVPAPTCSVSVSRADPARVERVEQARREVQRGGRRCDRPLLAREHRLIIVAVRLVRRRASTRCKAAAASARRVRAATRPARRHGSAGAPIRPRLARPPMRATPRRSRSCRRSRARFALRRNACHSRGPSRLCSVAPMLASPRRALELRRDDLGVVEDQHVAGAKQCGRSST